MRAYIFFKQWTNVPPASAVLGFVFGKNFCSRNDVAGFLQDDKTKKPINFQAQWPKWIENPRVPDYARFSSVQVFFSPLSKREIPYNRSLVARAMAQGLPESALVYLGDAGGVHVRRPALVDQRTFHRLTLFLARAFDGKIFETSTHKFLSTKEYSRRHASVINRPFRERLRKEDLRRLRRARK